MSDQILYSQDNLEEIISGLRQIRSDLDHVHAALSSVNRSERAGGRVRGPESVSLSGIRSTHAGGGTVQNNIDSYLNVIRGYSGYADGLAKAVSTVSSMLAETENKQRAGLDGDDGGKNAVDTGSEALDQDSGLFDNQGGYGGDQGDLDGKSGFKFLFWRLFKDQRYFDLVRQYPGYENYSDDEIADLFSQINQEGCGYVAMVNTIFAEYEGDPEGFQAAFGFPMYDEKGEFNYNRLLIDFYLNTNDKYYMDRSYGPNALANAILLEYKDNPDKFRQEYGVDLYADAGHKYWNQAAMNAVLKKYQGQDVVTRYEDGTTTYSLYNKAEQYLGEHGLKGDISISFNGMSNAEINQAIDSGKIVSISVGDFDMYNESGKKVHSDVGNHWMTITGITPDGRYIVSSWGEKYYLKPGDLKNPHYITMDIKREGGS